MKKMLAMMCAALCALAASAKTSTPKGAVITTVFVDGTEKPVIETDAYAEMLRAVQEGKFRFNGEGVRLTSMSVRRP